MPEPEPQGQRQVDPMRVLEKVQQDPTGSLLVQNAVQACFIEDQNEMIKSLKEQLLEKNGGGGGE